MSRRTPTHLIAAAFSLAGLALAASALAGTAAPQYTLTDLGMLPGSFQSTAFAINNTGEVVGRSDLREGGSEAFLYSNGAMQRIPNVGDSAEANGITSSGVIVGIARSSKSFIYSGGTVQYIDVAPPAYNFQAAAINDSGQIAGTYLGPAGAFEAAIYNDGTLQSLNLDGRMNYATGINAGGQVVGIKGLGSRSVGFIYSNGAIQYVPPLESPGPNDAGSVSAFGINDAGEVVGGASITDPANPASYVFHAFLYSDGVTHDLGTLPGTANNSSAIAINNAGEVVGRAYEASTGTRLGFLYADGTLFDLNDLTVGDAGYVIVEGNAINDRGQIAADAITPSGEQHAVLLSPTAIPLPPAAWMGLGTMGLLGGFLVCRQRRFRCE